MDRSGVVRLVVEVVVVNDRIHNLIVRTVWFGGNTASCLVLSYFDMLWIKLMAAAWLAGAVSFAGLVSVGALMRHEPDPQMQKLIDRTTELKLAVQKATTKAGNVAA